jgi:hypothetical protein
MEKLPLDMANNPLFKPEFCKDSCTHDFNKKIIILFFFYYTLFFTYFILLFMLF